MLKKALATLALLAFASTADAACNITAINSATLSAAVTMSPLSVTGQNAVQATLNATFNTSGGSDCGLAVRIGGSLTSGGNTMPYSISTSNGGSPTISHTGTVGSTSMVTSSSIAITVYFIVPAGNYPVGTYSDTGTVEVQVYDTSSTPTLNAVRAVSATLQNTLSVCTIGGTASGGTQNLDFSAGAAISTGVKTAVFGTVNCNNTAKIRLTSQNGGATTTAGPGTSHQRFFDYEATTTVNGANVTLDTATNGGTGVSEFAESSITAASTTNAPLNISVTPRTPVKPLVAGSYLDVLTITVTPD